MLAKYMLLRSSLETLPEFKTLLGSLPPGAASYKTVIHRLEDRYGNAESLLNHHLAKLKSLPMVMPQQVAEAENLVDTVEGYQTC